MINYNRLDITMRQLRRKEGGCVAGCGLFFLICLVTDIPFCGPCIIKRATQYQQITKHDPNVESPAIRQLSLICDLEINCIYSCQIHIYKNIYFSCFHVAAIFNDCICQSLMLTYSLFLQHVYPVAIHLTIATVISALASFLQWMYGTSTPRILLLLSRWTNASRRRWAHVDNANLFI